jgi:uncharacterized protein involved in exopolysaccharide biosynthesis
MFSASVTDDTAAGCDHPGASGIAIATILLRYRALILSLGIALGVVAAVLASLSPRTYESSALLQPQAADGESSGLAVMASRLGFVGPSKDGEWGAALYAELVETRSLLEPMLDATVALTHEDSVRRRVLDILAPDEDDAAYRREAGLRRLREAIRVRHLEEIGAISISAATRWPLASRDLVRLIIERLEHFNRDTRRTQAAVERRFVAAQTDSARVELERAESDLLSFLEKNRDFGDSPELTFEHGRLQRAVDLKQDLYRSLVQSLADARIREVRNTPVFTTLDPPSVAQKPNPRNILLSGVLGILAGTLLGVLVAFGHTKWRDLVTRRDPEVIEFLTLVRSCLPFTSARG